MAAKTWRIWFLPSLFLILSLGQVLAQKINEPPRKMSNSQNQRDFWRNENPDLTKQQSVKF